MEVLFNEIINNSYLNKEDVCLITGEILDNNYIKLPCNHKFNYEPLCKEFLMQKTKKILDNSKLRINELKCPYCRNISDELMPYFKYYNIKYNRLVFQSLNNNSKTYTNYICQHISKNNNKCNNCACFTNNGFFCNKHVKYTKNDEKILEKISKDEYFFYKSKKIVILKELLKKNKCKVSGNKNDLIERILLEKVKKNNVWIEI